MITKTELEKIGLTPDNAVVIGYRNVSTTNDRKVKNYMVFLK